MNRREKSPRSRHECTARFIQVLEQNSMNILKKELKRSQGDIGIRRGLIQQLERDYDNVQKDIKVNKQQIEVLRNEKEVSLQKFRHFQKELENEQYFRDLANETRPPSILVEVACSFARMVYLGSEMGWAEFQNLAHSFEEIKDAKNKFAPLPCLTDNLAKSLLHIWHNHAEMEAKLRRISEAGVLLLNFVFYSLEHKIKSEKYEEAKIILPENKERLQYLREQTEQNKKIMSETQQFIDNVRQDIQYEQHLSMNEKVENRKKLVDKYELYKKYELVQDKKADHKKIILKARGRKSTRRSSSRHMMKKREEFMRQSAQPRESSWFTEDKEAARKSYDKFTDLKVSQVSSIQKSGNWVDDDYTSRRDSGGKNRRLSSFEDDFDKSGGPFSARYGKKSSMSEKEERQSIYSDKSRKEVQYDFEEEEGSKEKHKESTTMTAKFQLTPHSERNTLNFNSLRSPSYMESSMKRNSPQFQREIYKERNPTLRLSTASNSFHRLSQERRASFTHLPPQKPSPRHSFGKSQNFGETRYDGVDQYNREVISKPINYKYLDQSRRGYTERSLMQVPRVRIEQETAESDNACCSTKGWRKYFCY